MSFSIDAGFIAEANEKAAPALVEDYDQLGRVLARRGLEAEAIAKKVAAFGVALPTWGVGTGGTRFARFPGPGEPRRPFPSTSSPGQANDGAARNASKSAGRGPRPIRSPPTLAT